MISWIAATALEASVKTWGLKLGVRPQILTSAVKDWGLTPEFNLRSNPHRAAGGGDGFFHVGVLALPGPRGAFGQTDAQQGRPGAFDIGAQHLRRAGAGRRDVQSGGKTAGRPAGADQSRADNTDFFDFATMRLYSSPLHRSAPRPRGRRRPRNRLIAIDRFLNKTDRLIAMPRPGAANLG